MAFVIPDLDNCDLVTFYIRKDFSDNPRIVSHHIDYRDTFALPYYIKKYMDTNVAKPRPGTPANLIVRSTPRHYCPVY